jgi:prophage regulatory protein
MSADDTNKPPRSLPDSGLLRLSMILAPNGPIPVARSTWWAGVRAGRFPQPVKLGERITCWRAEDIHDLLKHGAKEKTNVRNRK